MTLRRADILFKDQIAGSLEETNEGGTRFSYDPACGVSIACCFPISRREHEWRYGLHPFFQHLGPEGWLRERQARTAHVADEDDLGLLLRYGADCIGAVGVTSRDESRVPTEGSVSAVSPGRTVSGVQRKLLVNGNAADGFEPATAQGLAPYIAKFNSERLSTLVQNEALSLRWTAAVLGEEEVTRFRMARIASLDEVALVVERFDRKNSGEKLRLEDFAQILCKPKGSDYSGKYDAGYEQVSELIKTHSDRPIIDLLRFFRRLIAFVLIGNCDAHLKNFSMLETGSGLRLSPAYDVVNTVVYDGFDQTLALTIDGRRVHHGDVDEALFRTFGQSIGLSDRVIDAVFSDLRKRMTKARSLLGPRIPGGEGGFLARHEDIVSDACLRILGV